MDTHEHLFDIIEDFDTAMLVTRGTGNFHARPMAVARFEDGTDAYFATSIDSPKVAEIEAHPDVLLTFQGTSTYASVEGRASVVKDRALIEKLWSPAWKAWFPQGKDDPSLCILKIDPLSAEYWDNSGTKGLRYLFEGAKAVLQGRKAQADASQHAEVKL